jgi:hypothetical protein
MTYNPPHAPPPLDMTVHDRTKRLYEFLLGMGLIVRPHYDENLNLLSLSVSVSLPLLPKHVARKFPKFVASKKLSLVKDETL